MQDERTAAGASPRAGDAQEYEKGPGVPEPVTDAPEDMGSLSATEPGEYGDDVDIASEESFPASDPPSWSRGTT